MCVYVCMYIRQNHIYTLYIYMLHLPNHHIILWKKYLKSWQKQNFYLSSIFSRRKNHVILHSSKNIFIFGIFLIFSLGELFSIKLVPFDKRTWPKNIVIYTYAYICVYVSMYICIYKAWIISVIKIVNVYYLKIIMSALKVVNFFLITADISAYFQGYEKLVAFLLNLDLAKKQFLQQF